MKLSPLLRITLAFTLFISIGPTFAQSREFIVGEWHYSGPIDIVNLDQARIDMLNASYASMWFSFRTDGTYKTNNMSKDEVGTWSFDPEASLITLKTETGGSSSVQVIAFKEGSLLIGLGDGSGFRMTRVIKE